jgi:hypothetical protein
MRCFSSVFNFLLVNFRNIFLILLPTIRRFRSQSVVEEGEEEHFLCRGFSLRTAIYGAMLTSPCLSCPTTIIPDGPSSPCPSGPNGSTRPPTSGPNFHVVLIQVTPVVHLDPLHVTPL